MQERGPVEDNDGAARVSKLESKASNCKSVELVFKKRAQTHELVRIMSDLQLIYFK